VVADTEELQIYRDLLLLRSKIALGDARGVLKQLASTSKPALQAVKMLASISIASDSEKEALGRSVEDLVAAHGGESASLMLRIAAALCFLELGNVKAALRLARKEESLEELSLEVVGFLKIDRIDLAEKVLKKMKDADDDDACTQMASIWVALASSTSSNLSESTDTLNELAERYGGRTSLILQLLGAVEMKKRDFAAAMKCFVEARSLALSNGETVPASVLLNSLVSIRQLEGVSAAPSQGMSAKISSEFESTHPSSSFFGTLQTASEAFDRAASNFS